MREVLTNPTSPNWVGQLRKMLAWPAEVMEARRVSAELAGLSERERSDIGGTRGECGATTTWRDESSADRAARARAVRAWYGHVQKAA
jgi:hypothetical protein